MYFKKNTLFFVLITFFLCYQDSFSKSVDKLATKAPRLNNNNTGNSAISGSLLSCNLAPLLDQLTQIQNNNTTLLSPCNAIPITAPVTITAPGYYCLAQDIGGIITIAANDVSLNLNNHTIRGVGAKVGVGITILPGTQRKVFNGRIGNFFQGVSCSGSDDTILQNLVIDNCELDGIFINTSTAILIESVIISNIENNGLRTTGTVQGAQLKNIAMNTVEIGFYFENISRSLIENCIVIDCISESALGVGFLIFSGDSVQFESCSVKNCSAMINTIGFAISGATNIVLKNCIAQNIISDSPTSNFTGGFISARIGFPTSGIEFSECSAIGIQGSAFTTGFEVDGQATSFTDCLAQECISTSTFLEGVGFYANGARINFTNCQAYNCSTAGFTTNSLGRIVNLSYQNCQSAFNGTGFITRVSNTLLGNCVAYNNFVAGFDIFAGAGVYNCFAFQNATDYIGAPNVQNANTQVDNADPGLTGPFAGANLFI